MRNLAKISKMGNLHSNPFKPRSSTVGRFDPGHTVDTEREHAESPPVAPTVSTWRTNRGSSLVGRLPPAEAPFPVGCSGRPRRCRNNASDSKFRFNWARDFRNFRQSYRPVGSHGAWRNGRPIGFGGFDNRLSLVRMAPYAQASTRIWASEKVRKQKGPGRSRRGTACDWAVATGPPPGRAQLYRPRSGLSALSLGSRTA